MRFEIYVCENYARDFEYVVLQESYEDVVVHSFPCLCKNKNILSDVVHIFYETKEIPTEKHLLCGVHCKLNRTNHVSSLVTSIVTREDCLDYLASKNFLNYIYEHGGYVISVAWLSSWENQLKQDGFTQDIARKYYKNFCRELVLMDTNILDQSVDDIKSFSSYLDIKYRIVDINLDKLTYYLRSLVYYWRLNNNKTSTNRK